jgi:outer membrane protein insertion porin family
MGGTFTNLDFTYSITNDRRDQAYQTNEGYYTKFVQSIPLYIDNSSFLNGVDINKYHTFSDDIKGIAKFYGRAILGVDEDVRLTERLHIPVNRIRGFESRKLGPKDGTDFIGGNYASALSFESQFPNLLPEDTKTDISLFADIANLWSVDYDSQLDSSNKIRSSVGMSANVYTMIGPLSFTLAKSISKAKTDITQAFAFRLGTSF